MNLSLTVILPVYNGEKYLKKCIDSILNQTFRDFEFLIIDDSSNDSSSSIIKNFDDSRIKLITNIQNQGLTKILNKGLKIANGNYIARIDQDDFSFKDRLFKQMEYLYQNPKTKLIGSSCNVIDENDKILKSIKCPNSRKKILEKFVKSNPFMHSSVIFDKETALNLGGYPESFVHAQDFSLWYSITSSNEVYNLSDKLVNIRWHNERATLSETNKKHIKNDSIRVYRQALRNKEISIFHRIIGYLRLALKPWIIREFFGFNGKF
jgi:glycosyltransferase involved in cell wall biosynthesis